MYLPSARSHLNNCFAVGDLRPAHIRLHAEFAHHAVHDDFQMQLAHPGDQSLAGVWLRVHAERGIFLRQLRQRIAHLFLIRLGLRLDGHGNYRGRKFDGFQNDRLFFIAERVARGAVFQAHAGGDVASVDGFDFFAFVRVHAQQSADAVARLFRRVINVPPDLHTPEYTRM